MPKQGLGIQDLMGKTNDTTRDILGFLFRAGVFAWRQNVLPIPMVRKGVFSGFRPGSKQGVSDIIGVVGANILTGIYKGGGISIFIEVKTGKDRLRPEQIGFIHNAQRSGAIVMVVKDFEDFLEQWTDLCIKTPLKPI